MACLVLLICGSAGASGATRTLPSARVALADGGARPPTAAAGELNRRLQAAIAVGQVEATRTLLAMGADPNAAAANGSTLGSWLGAGQPSQRHPFTDDDLVEVAKLLERYHCTFGRGDARPVNVITNLAPRRFPKTLAFLLSKRVASDLGPALKVVARGGDLDTIKALLDAGADPLAGVASTSALADAARAGQTASVVEMLRHVKDKRAPKVIVAYREAVRSARAQTAQAFRDAGVEDRPAPSAPARLQPRPLTPELVRLLKTLGLPSTRGLSGLAGDMKCKLVEECGDLVFIDCNAAADGPAYYIDRKAAKLLARCGGACMHGCTDCPPKRWTCP